MTQAEALAILKTGVNVFLTGEPGAGKTHTINQYVSYLRQHGIEPALTASTGIAATHIGGMTIHSWSGIGIKKNLNRHEISRIASSGYINKRISRAKILIIDEISMLTGETLEMVDAVCRQVKQNQAPFGGLQIILVGDFFQLPPIIKEERGGGVQTALLKESPSCFAYESLAWQRARLATCYLTEQHRQDDADFFSLLSAIRSNAFSDHHLKQLASRKIEVNEINKNAPMLFSHNVDVDRVNNATLEKLSGQEESFMMSGHGRGGLVAALKKGCLSPETLRLKIGAAVMFTKNNQREGFVNGTLGTVVGFDQEENLPMVRLKSGQRIIVGPMEWKMEENGQVLATISQLPLRLAWAITVHKSQGMSLDEAVMDLSDVFEYGQGYVALSRVRRLAGLAILGWNERVFQVHPEVLLKDGIFRQASEEFRKEFFKFSANELSRKHDDFIIACGGEIRPAAEVSARAGRKPEKADTRVETFVLWKQEKNIARVAKIRGLKEDTVLAHLEKLFRQGKTDGENFQCLLTPNLALALAEIHAAFKKLGVERLAPVFEKFGGVYSYRELRIARMMIKN